MTATPELQPAEAAFPVLHRLRIAGRVPAEQLPADEQTLAALAGEGALRMSERGCTLTGAGLRRHADLLTAERAGLDLVEIERAYTRFLQANQPVKNACALWQARAATAAEDDVLDALDSLESLLERVRPSLARVGALLPRFTEQLRRLEAALDHATEGDHSYLVEPGIASFHTVWFECHEDYLLTLGREREDEEREHDAAR